jgi:hypothetical protein
MLEPVMLMPLSIHVATASAAALPTSRRSNLIESIVPRIASPRIAPRWSEDERGDTLQI